MPPAAIVEGRSGSRRLTFTVTLSEASQQRATVRWATADGSAIAGRDYRAASGTVRFAPGKQTATVRVRVIGDRSAEPDETFFVSLSAPVRATLSATAQRATGTILDDDVLPQLAAFAALGEGSATAKKRR